MFIYTDGIYESVNSDGEEFGLDRLLKSVKPLMDKPLSELYADLLDTARSFSAERKLDDDACIVGFRLNHLV